MASDKQDVLYESDIRALPLVKRGKVRDMYAVDDQHLLIVASDRLSAFDVVLPDPIPGKGRILTQMSDFWSARTRAIIADHGSQLRLEDVIADASERSSVADRAAVVRRLDPLPVEAIVRGYLIGSGWKDYQQTGKVCGIHLPQGLRQAERLPAPIFTPSTKADVGDHDENISFDEVVDLIGHERAVQVRDASLRIYEEAAVYARQRGIIIADTKFEFGVDESGGLVLIDEVLTPDSSRFWPTDGYEVGTSPSSFDKQYVRDYLETLQWDKRPPAPRLPPEIIRQTSQRYEEALRRLTR